MALLSGTLAFLRQKSTSFMSVQDIEQTASLTGNTKPQLNKHTEIVYRRGHNKYKIETWNDNTDQSQSS